MSGGGIGLKHLSYTDLVITEYVLRRLLNKDADDKERMIKNVNDLRNELFKKYNRINKKSGINDGNFTFYFSWYGLRYMFDDKREIKRIKKLLERSDKK